MEAQFPTHVLINYARESKSQATMAACVMCCMATLPVMGALRRQIAQPTFWT